MRVNFTKIILKDGEKILGLAKTFFDLKKLINSTKEIMLQQVMLNKSLPEFFEIHILKTDCEVEKTDEGLKVLHTYGEEIFCIPNCRILYKEKEFSFSNGIIIEHLVVITQQT